MKSVVQIIEPCYQRTPIFAPSARGLTGGRYLFIAGCNNNTSLKICNVLKTKEDYREGAKAQRIKYQVFASLRLCGERKSTKLLNNKAHKLLSGLNYIYRTHLTEL